MLRAIRTTGLAFILFALAIVPLHAEEPCSPDAIANAVDAAGEELRNFSAKVQPNLRKQLKELQEKKGWPPEGYEEKGLDLVRDNHIAELDEKADELLTRIDALGRAKAETAGRCQTMDAIKASASELLAVMRTKTTYVEARINRELGVAPASTAVVAPPPNPAPPPAAAKPSPKTDTPQAEAAQRPSNEVPASKQQGTKQTAEVSEKPAAAKPKPTAHPEPPVVRTEPQPSKALEARPWSTMTAPDTQADVEPYPQAPTGPLPTTTVPEEGYSIEEIKEASRGFFGTVSTALGSVIEHAFSQSGRPSAYVLGTEAGGALLAGLRYGSGTMYLRNGGTRPVFWHGPSVGYDVGAEGSRTLFLIYHLDNPERIYRRYTGVDGSAYLVGGVGLTFLKGGNVLMAPIRSGLGLRLGANLGYVRFTPRPTWNPF